MKAMVLSLVLASAALAQEPLLTGKPGANLSSVRSRGIGVTAESLHSYDVRHYRLDINLPMTNKSYVAHEGLAIKAVAPSVATCSLNFVHLVCDSVKRSGTTLTFATDTILLVVTLDPPLPQGDSTVLDIFYHRESTATDRGYFFTRPGGPYYHAYCMTCTAPEDARYWMPCYDEPMDKAERGVDLNLTAPDSFQTCANGLLDSVVADTANHTKTWYWNHPYSIATYLIVFAASRFATWQHNIALQTGDTLPSKYFIWPEDSSVSQTNFSLIPDMMTYFSDSVRFGPYPFEKYGMVPGYYGFQYGGMENQTLTMIATQWLRSGDPVGMAHEMSHMWWGDMVTCVDFANVWLNEGFATWAECLYDGHMNGRTPFNAYISNKAQIYISQHHSRDFPIYNPPPAEIYNPGIIYDKGSWVLRMLQFVEGDTAWNTRASSSVPCARTATASNTAPSRPRTSSASTSTSTGRASPGSSTNGCTTGVIRSTPSSGTNSRSATVGLSAPRWPSTTTPARRGCSTCLTPSVSTARAKASWWSFVRRTP